MLLSKKKRDTREIQKRQLTMKIRDPGVAKNLENEKMSARIYNRDIFLRNIGNLSPRN